MGRQENKEKQRAAAVRRRLLYIIHVHRIFAAARLTRGTAPASDLRADVGPSRKGIQ